MSNYRCGLVLSLTELKKPLRSITVDVGANEPLTIVTSAPNVRESSRIVVACVGATVPMDAEEDDEDKVVVTKRSVGGVMSEGMVCDSKMLGWTGGGEGVAVQVPESFELGAEPPSSRPRMDGGSAPAVLSAGPVVEAEPLFEKKMTKEEKKAAAKAKREAKKAAKAAAVQD